MLEPSWLHVENGPIPGRYPLQELPGGNYLKRTRQNVADSDGSLVISFGELSGGTLKTVSFCERLEKPMLLVDAPRNSTEVAAIQAAGFVLSSSIKVLNVAGPRESKHLGARVYAEHVVRKLMVIDGSR